ncbi:DUF3775 domain-containing protein [Aliiruegeria sabulilitoris]|uniref:DUF3775 domain-containing protein n=1 Tax=Aliiruegeria sabulilitoris TaxID=1510458 RepID=UPI0008346F5E|nr:DUF3775 domain-containing protein [Aliiruegeria sabulilitoris]NDR55620.1 DUF3775 domain-containing protein [Pseudoruegeria sp. M32A2M]
MLEISTGKLVRVIALAREYGPENAHLRDYISGLNVDEQVNLVALVWIGRDSFAADELEDALDTARRERSAPTEDYLGGMPDLANFIEDGMEALGMNVAHEEDHLRERD